MSNYSRSRTRKFLYQMLYASTFSQIENETFRESFFSGVFDSQIDEDYLKEMYDLILKNEMFLVEIIKMYAPKFDIVNMDLSCVIPIFIGATEILFYKEEIPVKVSMNEAVEISKVYGDDSSRKIVNGVMNKVFHDVELLQEKYKYFDMNEPKEFIFKRK